jgi:hypothetical protein
MPWLNPISALMSGQDDQRLRVFSLMASRTRVRCLSGTVLPPLYLADCCLCCSDHLVILFFALDRRCPVRALRFAALRLFAWTVHNLLGFLSTRVALPTFVRVFPQTHEVLCILVQETHPTAPGTFPRWCRCFGSAVRSLHTAAFS